MHNRKIFCIESIRLYSRIVKILLQTQNYNLTSSSDSLWRSPASYTTRSDRKEITIMMETIRILSINHIGNIGKRPHLSMVCMSRDNEINRVFHESIVECWLMFQENCWLIFLEIQCIEEVFESSCRFTCMVGHSSKNYSVEHDFLIIENSDM